MQSVHGPRAALAEQIFKLPHHQFRVVCDNMGGGFGMKGGCYPEYALSLWASEVTGRPVRWIAERCEGLLSDEQSRGSVVDTELALDRDGKFLALRARWAASIGAYYSTDRPTIPLTSALGCLVNTYTIPAVHVEVTAVLTNTMTIAPYRGGGRPEPIYVTETIIDKAARELGIDPAELRRRNTIPAERDAVHDADAADLRQRRFRQEPRRLPGARRLRRLRRAARAAQQRGKLLGVGVATAVAASGGRDYEHAEIRFDPSGGVVLMTGSMDHGQGHGTTFKQVLSEKLGIDADLIRYRYGDSDLVTMGIGTFGSRSAQLAGSAIVIAADRLIDKGRHIAAHMMEAARDDIVFENGRFAIAGTDRVGRHRRGRQAIVPRRRNCPTTSKPGSPSGPISVPTDAATFPSGAHLCEVEIDAETGEVEADPLCRGRRCRHRAEPAVVRGADPWRHRPGGRPGADGEPRLRPGKRPAAVSGSFQDYCMPRADNFCAFDARQQPDPDRHATRSASRASARPARSARSRR